MRLRLFLHVFVLYLCISCLSCSWSAEQRDVMESYNTVTSLIDSGEWQEAMPLLSDSTVALLDSWASDLTSRGLLGYGSGADLLSMLSGEYIDFNGEVTMIFIQGAAAEVTLSADESRIFRMVHEDGVWKLDLSQLLENNLNKAFEGSYVDLNQ